MESIKVDFHTHVISEDFLDLTEKYNDFRFPRIDNKCSCGAEIIVKGKTFRKISNNAWDVAERIKEMDQEGVDIQVLSPIPVTFSYWAEADAALELSKFQNDFINSLVKSHPERFIGMGTVPLQNIEMAIEEMERMTNDLNLKGIQIGTNVNGMNLDDDYLFPFFEAAEKMNVPIFVHPWATFGSERLQKYNSMYTVGMPSETALAASSVIMSGLLDKLPGIKLCFAHGGGSLPYLLPRLDKGWKVWPETRQTKELPSENAKRLYYDSLVYDEGNLKLMIERLGSDRIIAGTDYPFLLREKPFGSTLGKINDISEEEKNNMLGINALDFLGLKNN